MYKYLAIFKLSFLNAFKNYKVLLGLSVFLMTCLIIFAHLWKIAATRAGAVSLSPEQLLWYIAFNEWVLISIPDTQDDMQEDLQSGRLAYLLPRPISYLGSTLAESLGSLFANLLVLGSVTFLFTWWQAGALPFDSMAFIVALIFGIFAALLAVMFQMLIGLSAFWLQDVTPFYWIWEKLLFMLGGLILPLSVYPGWLQTLAKFTPFPAILGQRSALALNFNSQSVLDLTISLIGWLLFSFIALMLVYRRGLRILNVEGG